MNDRFLAYAGGYARTVRERDLPRKRRADTSKKGARLEAGNPGLAGVSLDTTQVVGWWLIDEGTSMRILTVGLRPTLVRTCLPSGLSQLRSPSAKTRVS